jgi:hypothetical protein
VHCCDSHLHCARRLRRFCHNNWASLSPTLRADPPSDQQAHSKVSLRRGVNAGQRCGAGRGSNAKGRVQPERREQPANLAVEGAEESQSTPPRLQTHRTSPAQALLTISLETCCNPTSDLL